MKKIVLLISLAFVGFTFTSCDDDDNNFSGYVEMTDENNNANDASKDASLARWEMPRVNNAYDYITHYTSDGLLNYAMEYSTQKMHSHWVAYRYDSKLKSQVTSRSDQWGAEPYYNNDKAHQVDVCYFSGYNRGHLVGSAERLYSVEANVQTFYMSNMSPMVSAFNTTYWGTVEDYVRNWGRACAAGDTLYVVKGGTIADGMTKGTISVPTSNGSQAKMVVPKYYFIAVLSLSANGTAKAIGFWMEHKDYANTTADYLKKFRQASACSIDELEEKTGIDFFCNLPDWIENVVEARYTRSSWSGL